VARAHRVINPPSAHSKACDRLLKDATARKINMIAPWSVDRPGRRGGEGRVEG
jgi:hypothetical protein